MMGMNCDRGGNEAETQVEKNRWRWLQARVNRASAIDVWDKYRAFDLPSIWLIGRDRKVIARDLRGARIKDAVARALRSE
jgi:hypothetical protein